MMAEVDNSQLKTSFAQASASLGALDKTLGAKSSIAPSALEDKLQVIGSSVEMFNEVAQAAAPIAGVSSIQERINSFEDTCAVLMSVLDVVAEAHPFVKVAVMAFKTVVMLKTTTRDNDKKIVGLKVQMMDMMSSLTILQNGVKYSQSTEMLAIRARLSDRMGQVADDIRDCANVCDGFQKRKILVRVIKSAVWNTKLAAFGDIFAQHTNSIQQDLTLYTGVTLSEANEKLTNVGATLRSADEKIDMLLLFDQLRSPKEREILDFIKSKGGADKCMSNETTFKELVALSEQQSSIGRTMPTSMGQAEQAQLMSTVTQELRADLDEFLKDNMRIFEVKFETQRSKLEEVVRRESDRTIRAFGSGPHDKILDQDLHDVWREMKWKGSVKARSFVLTLRDWYTERLHTLTANSTPQSAPAESEDQEEDSPKDGISELPKASKDGEQSSSRAVSFSKADKWTLRYINVLRIQPLIEAFDDDASGFISVVEANKFTSDRPTGWRVPQWIAYCAAGFHLRLLIDANNITNTLRNLHQSLDDVLPANRVLVDGYLASPSVINIDRLLAGISRGRDSFRFDDFSDEALIEATYAYEKFESDRLRSALEKFEYNIDAANTLTLIAGTMRIEMWLTSIIRLLLDRHSLIIKTAQVTVLSPQELSFAAESFQTVWDSVTERLDGLKAVFLQQNLDIDRQLQRFSHGLFAYWEKDLDAINKDYYSLHSDINSNSISSDEDENKDDEDDKDEDDDEQDASDMPEEERAEIHLDLLKNGGGESNTHHLSAGRDVSDFAPLLHFGPDVDDLDFDGYANPNSLDHNAGDAEGHYGTWNGLYHYSYGTGTGGLMAFTFHSAPSTEDLYGSGTDALGSFTVDGKRYSDPGEKAHFIWRKTYDTYGRRDGKKLAWRYEGTLTDNGGQAITGYWGPESSPAKELTLNLISEESCYGTFEIYRRSIDFLMFGPSDEDLKANRWSALWRFAIAATLHSVRQRLFSWSMMLERRQQRQKFVRLSIIRDTMMRAWGPDLEHAWLQDVELKELQYLEDRLLPEDARFYRSIATRHMRRTVVYPQYCDSCRETIVGTRYMCLTCSKGQIWNTIDLCGKCITKSVPTSGHFAHHQLLQMRTCLHWRHTVHMTERGATVLDGIKSLLEQINTPTKAPVAGLKEMEGGDTESQGQERTRRCLRCQRAADGTIWACLICKEGAFLCAKCNDDDEAHKPWLYEHRQTSHVGGESHTRSHPLARYVLKSESGAADQADESKSAGLERRIAELETRCASQEKTIVEMESLKSFQPSVEERLSRIEDLLARVLDRLDPSVGTPDM